MNFPITYRGEVVGSVHVQEDGHGMLFHAVCPANPIAEIVRLYVGTPTPVKIGVLEPEGEKLILKRRLTKESLRVAGIQEIPQTYYLDDGKAGDVIQKDTSNEKNTQEQMTPMDKKSIMALVEQGRADAWKKENGYDISIPFLPGQAHDLAFALTACRIAKKENGYIAILSYGSG